MGILERFQAKYVVDPDSGCWVWTAARDAFGYGYFSNPKVQRAHRSSYLLFRGAIPPGLCVCHRCDNPSCVNPDHLFLGTRADNNLDCDLKNRRPKRFGEDTSNAKLTAKDVAEIRASTELQKVLAARYGINQGQVSRIRSGKRWPA